MKPSEFYELSWWEWSIWLNAILSDQKKRRQEQEFFIRLQRDWIAYYINSKLDKNAEPYEGSDFYPLPGDEDSERKKSEFRNPQELEEEMRKRVALRRTK